VSHYLLVKHNDLNSLLC